MKAHGEEGPSHVREHATNDDPHAHADHDAHDIGGASHSTLKGYITGFVLSVILTAVPFWLVMGKVFEKPAVTALVILAFAAVQIVVHMVYFLHMDSKSQGGWTMLAMIFTAVLVGITLIGSLWVMNHLKTNMMPMSTHQSRTMP